MPLDAEFHTDVDAAYDRFVQRTTPTPPPPSPTENYETRHLSGPVTKANLVALMNEPRDKKWRLITGDQPHGFSVPATAPDGTAHLLDVPPYTVLAGMDTHEWTVRPQGGVTGVPTAGSWVIFYVFDGTMMNFDWPTFNAAGQPIGERYPHPTTLCFKSQSRDIAVYSADIHDSTSSPLGNMETLLSRIKFDGLRVWNLDTRYTADPAMHQVPMGCPGGGATDITVQNFSFERWYTLWGSTAGSNTRLTHRNGWFCYMNPAPLLYDSTMVFDTAGKPIGGRRDVQCVADNLRAFGSTTTDFPRVSVQETTGAWTNYTNAAADDRPDRVELAMSNIKLGWDATWGTMPNIGSTQSNPHNPALLTLNSRLADWGSGGDELREIINQAVAASG